MLVLLIYLLAFILVKPVLGKTNYIIIKDINGQVAFNLINDYQGQYVEIEKVNPFFINSIIAIEDEKFYAHKGIDLSRLIQSFFINLFKGKIVQGGSTITQQLSKNLYFNHDQTIVRKLKEAFIAISIETHYKKDKIMEDYINSLYFGEDIYGIYQASHYFFNKEPEALTLKESACLASIINAPNYYSPKKNPVPLNNRINLVLNKMLSQNFISEEEYKQAYDEVLEYQYNSSNDEHSSLNYYKDAVIEQLKKLDLYQDKYLGQGLIIETTLNKNITVDLANLLSLYQRDDPNIEVALVALTPFSNEVVTLIGGFDYEKSPYNRAIYAKRQIGSTIKPLIYYLGLLNGMSPLSELTSQEETFYIKDIGIYSPSNFNDAYANRKINMIEAIATSDNIYAVKTTLLLGSKTICDSLKEFDASCKALPSIALGTPELSPLQLATIYNTFASLGEYHRPALITKVTTMSNNRVIYKKKDSYKTLLDKDSTLILNQMLQAPFDLNIKSYVSPTLKYYQPKAQYAAKSGSTTSDSYVIAYNPNVTICVWVGTNDGSELKNSPLAKEIFLMVANYFASLYPSMWYAPSYNLTIKKIEASSGTLTSNGTPYYFSKQDSLIVK